MVLPSDVERWVTDVRDNKRVLVKLKGLHFIAYGVFSNVYKGQQIHPVKRTVVVKKTWTKRQDCLKEVIILSALSKLNHKNIMQLCYTFKNDNHPDDRVCHALVFEFMASSLYAYQRLLRDKGTKMNLVDVKLFVWQLFRAQGHLAQHSVCHRDVKPQNILIDPDSGLLKLADFGSSKFVKRDVESTSYQITRYYRPPELLLCSNRYGPAVDVWSCGCVFGELLLGSVLMRGKDTMDQLTMIIRRIGLPTVEERVAMQSTRQMDDLRNIEVIRGRFRGLLVDAPEEAVQLINRVLVYSPSKRLSGSDFLADKFFDEIFTRGAVRTNGQAIQLFDKDERAIAIEEDASSSEEEEES